MKVGYAVLYENGELVISKNHTLLQKIIIKDYGEFEDINVPWKNEYSQIKKVQILDQVKSNYMKKWFIHCNHLTTLIEFTNLDVSDCVDFSFMFAYCESLQNINELQNWNVLNGTDFSFMFYDCQSLQDLNGLQNWNVSKGTEFSRMFSYCISLQNINALHNWNVSKGTDFSFMFCTCESLQDLNGLQNWNVFNGTDFSFMFNNCKSLQEISLSNTLDILTKEMFELCNPKLKIHWKNHLYTYEDLSEYEKIY